MLELVLPHPPSINHYWRRVGSRTLISREGRRFQQEVQRILVERQIEPISEPVAVTVIVHPPDDRRRDVDNLAKALLDALGKGGAYHDDSQIVRLSIEKRDIFPGGQTLVRIETVHDYSAPVSGTSETGGVPLPPHPGG